MGHVDHGKSTILDSIRGTAIVNSEPGAITQSIGASIIPLSVIKKICGRQIEQFKVNIDLPGILFIDTPGHAAFTNLRKRGGNLADIAILVIDVNEGPKDQTQEVLEIIKKYKIPFVVAANKIDLIPNWRITDYDLLQEISVQRTDVKEKLDEGIYKIVGWLSENGFQSERFDRVRDFTKEVAIIPLSAKTGTGIPEMLVILLTLVQKYMKQNMIYLSDENAKGTILEVKETKGDLRAMDVILYEGILRKGETIVVGTLNEPIVTKIRGLFQPASLNEMRDEKSEFKSVEEVYAATGVRIIAKGIENAVAGMPVIAVKNASDVEKVKKNVEENVNEVIIDTDSDGIVVKADSLGSLEALTTLLNQEKVHIKKATIGQINKKDILDARTSKDENKIILAFNIEPKKDIIELAKTEGVTIISDVIIYKLIERLQEIQDTITREKEMKILNAITSPFKIKVLKNYIFRQSNPAVVGVEVIAGVLKTGQNVMTKEGKVIGSIREIQKDMKNVKEAKKNEQVAVSITNAVVGRSFNGDDILYSDVKEDEYRKLKQLKKYLDNESIDILREISEIKRKNNPTWGI